MEQLGYSYQPERYQTEVYQAWDYIIDDINPLRKSHKTLMDEGTNLNELSSIYENTEEEMWTPDRDLKIDYSSFKYYKHGLNGAKLSFKDSTTSKPKNYPDFFQRMNQDVVSRKVRNSELQEMFSKPHVYPAPNKKLSTKYASQVVDRLHSNEKPKIKRRILPGDCVKSLSSSKSEKSLISSKCFSYKSRVPSSTKHRLSINSSIKSKFVVDVSSLFFQYS